MVGVRVGVCQSSAVTLLLFTIVKDSLTYHLSKDMQEFFYADDLAIVRNSWKVSTKMKKSFRKQKIDSETKRTKAVKFV